MEQFLQVGVISSTHGIRGEVKVFPTTDDPNRFKKLKKVILETKKEKLSLEVQGVKFFKQFVIVKFKGIDNINHILTLFPDMVMQGLCTSIIGRAVNNGLLSIEAVNIRDYAFNKHQSVDDYPYGGGAGMLMQAEPVYQAYEAIAEKVKKKPRVVYLSPQGATFSQTMAEELAKEEELVLLCGHYEGIDERVLEEIVTDYVSIGDYVLTGGELPAMVMVDAISRLIPGVLHNDVSAEFESFQDDLLEYPQYSRPEEWHGKKVPPILLSGHHANIEKWRREQSIIRTKERRPDLLEKCMKSGVLDKKEMKFLQELLAKDEENA